MEKIFLVSENLKERFNIVRIENDCDIPQILWNCVVVIQDNIYLTFSKDHISCPLGSLIGWSATDSTVSNCWYIETISPDWVEKNGYFYKPIIFEAEKIDDDTYQLSKQGFTDTTILKKSDPTYKTYSVCDQNGKVIDYLYKLDPIS